MKFTPQHDQMDCGPACLSMIASHYGKEYSIQFLRETCYLTREGVSLLAIVQAADKMGMTTLSAKLTVDKLIELVLSSQVPMPCILHWNQSHFVVLRKINRNSLTRKYTFQLADPGHGFITLSQDKFEASWLSEDKEGVAMFVEPTPKFYELNPQKNVKFSIRYLLDYLIPFRKHLSVMLILLLIGSGLNLIFPFLTQDLIDKGINHKNLNLIVLILIAQLSLFVGVIVIEILRNWITLIVGAHLSINIISDFLKKIFKLPIKFFDSKMVGDLQQRIQDNERIEHFITSQSILTVFSMITFIVFFGVLCYYSYEILAIYLVLTIVAVFWSFAWLKKRKIVDYFRFQEQSRNQSSIYEILNGVTEMKLNQLEDYKRNEWEEIQKKLFKINIRILRLDQFQNSGFEFFNQLKNILVTCLAAYFVVQDKMTLGQLMSVSYIIGQMNSPVNQLVTFFRSLQDARLSLERLNEVQQIAEEEQPNQIHLLDKSLNEHIERHGIQINNLSFQYQGPMSPFVLKDIDLFIPEGKVTAIVGISGSGKTTLMKLLLKFYESVQGDIFYNEYNINELSAKSLRENVGVVMQDGFIFSDTMERNIATSDSTIDNERLQQAVQIACIKDFIEELPLGYKTKIGSIGNSISGGQRQRILIARAVYRNPRYIFLDEATSFLDAKSEKMIHDNLKKFFVGKTVIIIAHRLSTVKNADQIVVLEEGKIVEIGSHEELTHKQGAYYQLVKNQLELGN
ncbi:peptidase domain-containing ABC transporter [Microbacter margulisiae]|uniref:ATP-binding cassette subfamily B protein n=1 Tax=Microbacter margulisiae TaxID=1350067 RepID=A0A7W5DSM6_9PORP|nr:peptidase domain-containing ABC transporter [Microbacter margulisiae]MBB3188337.1 ATP-binding cassette subfamily B protein [Microbacter margulisiae]